MDPLKNEQKSATFINESGLYSLMLQSKLESAKAVVMYYISSSLLQSCRSHYEYHRDACGADEYAFKRF